MLLLAIMLRTYTIHDDISPLIAAYRLRQVTRHAAAITSC